MNVRSPILARFQLKPLCLYHCCSGSAEAVQAHFPQEGIPVSHLRGTRISPTRVTRFVIPASIAAPMPGHTSETIVRHV
jgi:hypothetical protein